MDSSWRKKEDAYKGLLVLGLSCLERRKERNQAQGVAKPHLSQEEQDSSMFWLTALQSNSLSLAESQALVAFSSGLSLETGPNVCKLGNTAAAIHHMLSQSKPGASCLVIADFSSFL